MKQLLLKANLTACLIFFATLNSNSFAQINDGALPPIIDLILNSNQAPINSVPSNNPLQIPSNETTIFPISASDADNNLESVQVQVTNSNFSFEIAPALLNTPSISLIENGFIVNASQQPTNFISAATSFTPQLVAINQINTAEITITSTDSEGLVTQDSFFIAVSIEQPANRPPFNSIISAPTPIDADRATNLSFSVADVDNNLTSIAVSSSLSASLQPASPNNVTVVNNLDNGFTISGTQQNLVDTINNVTFIPFVGNGSIHTITIRSTDSEGATDIDTVNITVNGQPIILIE